MKKETKVSLIIFCVVLVVAYIFACFIPDEILTYSTKNSTILSFLGDVAVAAIGMRGILAVAIALIAVLLIRIVDSNDEPKKSTAKKSTKTKKSNKETK